MLTKEKALYQVKLILDYLPKEEYELIPQETIDYIENNFEYDEKIIINPTIPLEEQNIDSKAYDMLEIIIYQTEKNKTLNQEETIEYVKKVEEFDEKFNEDLDMKIENIKLKNIIKSLENENAKILKAKELIEEYRELLKQKDNEIEELKENNKYLYESNQKIPKFIRRIFVKEDVRLLKSKID